MAFAYTVATNTVVATGGTSGTPLTFADFVTADRAGTGTFLLPAGPPASPTLPLDYAVRPVEDLAIKVKIVVSNTKTADTDYVFITGTDWHGDAQTESIDVSAGDGSYETTKYWATISNIDCSDNAAGGGTVWADGYVAVTQDIWGVIWDYGNSSQYQIDCDFYVGNGSTSTYFSSPNDSAYFADNMLYRTYGSATTNIGEASGDWSINGSRWDLSPDVSSGFAYQSSSTINIYSSQIHNRGDSYIQFNYGTATTLNSIFSSTGTNRRGIVTGSDAITTFKSVYNCNSEGPYFVNSPVIENFHSHTNIYGLRFVIPITVKDMYFTNNGTDLRCLDARGQLQLISKRGTTSPSVNISADGAWAQEQYPCNITVKNYAGTLLDGVEVLCEDEADATVWTTTTGDTDTGKIDEQIIIYKQWIDAADTLTTYSPHKFTFSKAGYKTLVKENITVDHPIVWEIELQYVAGARNQTVGMGVRMS